MGIVSVVSSIISIAVVISGTIAFGMGETFSQSALKNLGPGSYAMMPAEMRHFAMAKTAGIVQIHGTGPFVLNFVNPADDPARLARGSEACRSREYLQPSKLGVLNYSPENREGR